MTRATPPPRNPASPRGVSGKVTAPTTAPHPTSATDPDKEKTGGHGTEQGGAQDPTALRVIADLTLDADLGFATLYEAYQNAVYSTALRLSGHRQEAEDLAAETFLRAYRALCGYGPDRIAALRPRAWLLTILTNLWRNGLRTAARRPRTTPLTGPRADDSPDPTAHQIPDPSPGVETTVTHRETGRELAALLQRLPPAQRAAVVLRHVGDLPIHEIATVLDLPEGTVKSHISRGLTRLRKLHTTPGAATSGTTAPSTTPGDPR